MNERQGDSNAEAGAFVAERRVEFRDTDAAGIMHFSSFFTYMEQVEHQFLRHLGTSVMSHEDPDGVSWPRVSAHCDYRRPLRFEDVFKVSLSIARLGETSVTYHHQFWFGGNICASGKISAVCCRLEPGKPPQPTPIPESLRALFEPYCQPIKPS